MAKGKTNLRDTMKLTKKVPIKKTEITEIDIERTEKKVSKIHSAQTFRAGITLKSYMLDLARTDLDMEE